MYSKVRVKEGALRHFRKLAREAAPLEIQAYLAGNVLSIDTVEITDFLYTKDYAIQTNGEVCWTADELARVKERVEAEGKRILGEIHSHPYWDAVMSHTDYEANVTQQFILCGICSINENNRTRVRFWTPTSALPCRVIYV